VWKRKLIMWFEHVSFRYVSYQMLAKKKKATFSMLNLIYVKKLVMIISAFSVITFVIRCDINSFDINTAFVMSITLIAWSMIEKMRWLYDCMINVIDEIIVSFIVDKMSCDRIDLTRWWFDWWLIIWVDELIIWLINRLFEKKSIECLIY
jgi:hypothetical protein